MAPMSETLLYLAESLAWTAVGFIAGYLAARMTRDLNTLAHQRPRHVNGHLVLGVVVAVLGVLTVAQAYVSTRATERLTECQQRYSNEFADALDARALSAQRAQRSLDNLIRTLADPDAGQADRRAAVRAYLASRDEAETQQQRNPLPPAPRDLC